MSTTHNLVRNVYRKFFAKCPYGEKLRSIIYPVYNKIFIKNNLDLYNIKKPVYNNYLMVWCTEKLNNNSNQEDLISISNNCTVVGATRFVLCNNKASLDIARSNANFLELYTDYYLQEELISETTFNTKTGMLRLKKSSIGLNLHGQWLSTLHPSSENWMHFLGECAPRLNTTINNVGDLQFGILFDKNIPNTALEIIKILSNNRPLIGIPPNVCVEICKLITPIQKTSTSSGSWPRTPHQSKKGFFDFDSEALISTREKIFRHFSIKPQLKRNIYINRRSHFRHIINAKEVYAALEKIEFEALTPEEMPLQQQVTAFSETSILVAQAGAALANILFMPPGSKVICMYADSEWTNPNYFHEYAKACGVELILLKGQVYKPEKYKATELRSVRHPMNSDFTVSVPNLLSALNLI